MTRPEEFTAAQAADPATPAQLLADIAALRPDLRPLVARNPSTYPALLEWLASLREPAVDAALWARPRQDAGGEDVARSVDEALLGDGGRPAAPEGAGDGGWTPAAGGQRTGPEGPTVPAGTGPSGPADEPRPGDRAGAAPSGEEPTAPGFHGAAAHPTGQAPYPLPHGGYPSPQGGHPFPPGGYSPQGGYQGPPPGGYQGPPPGGYQGPPQGAAYSAPTAPWQAGTPYAPTSPRRSGNRTLWIVLGVLGGLLVLGVVGVVLLVSFLGRAAENLEREGSYGADAALDALWDDCEAGDGEACDRLYFESPVLSEYEEFGDTCGRREPGGSGGSCGELLGGEAAGPDGDVTNPATYGDDADLDGLWDGCEAGDVEACRDLYFESPIDSEYEDFGWTCGGAGDQCWRADTYGDDPELDVLWDACEAGDTAACGDLYWESPSRSDYEEFGATCGRTRETEECTG